MAISKEEILDAIARQQFYIVVEGCIALSLTKKSPDLVSRLRNS